MHILQNQKGIDMVSTWTAFFVIVFLTFLAPARSGARMIQLDDENLDRVQGQAGFSMAIKNIQVFQWTDSYRYLDSDNAGQGYLALEDIDITDSNGGPWTLNYDFGSVTKNGIIEFDLGASQVASREDWDTSTNPTQTEVLLTAALARWWDQDMSYHINRLRFGGPPGGVKDLGRLDIGPIDLVSFRRFLSPHEAAGMDFEYDIELHIGEISYGYKINPPNCDFLSFTNIHIGQSFDYGLSGDDPADTTTWKTDIGEFKIGDVFGDLSNNIHSNPASLDVGEICISGSQYATVAINLPLQGSIRFEKADFGGVDFGPGAIDGINAYRYKVLLIP